MGEFAVIDEVPRAEFPLASGRRAIAFPPGATWIGLLRRPCEAAGLRMTTAATMADCRDALDRWPQSLVLMELTPDNTESQLELVAEVAARRPDARVVVIAKGLAADGELLLREIGACDVITRVSDLGRAAAIAKAHAMELSPGPQDMLRETLCAIGLPIAE